MRKNRLWLLLVIVGLILPLAACGPKATPPPEEATPTPKLKVEATPIPIPPTPTPKPTPTPAMAIPGVPPEFIAMGEAMTKVKAYRTKMVAEGMEFLTEYVMPDKMHTKSEVMGMKVETIVIGDTTYTKIGDGPWEKEEAAPAPLGAPEMEMPDFTEMEEEMMATIEVEEVGMETVEGVKCKVFEIRSGEEGAEPVKYYIGVNDNLLRKIEAGEMGIIYYDYNASIEIEPPI